MKPPRDLLVSQLEGVDAAFIDAHLARLGDDYYAEFSLPEVVVQLRELSRLDAARPLAVMAVAAPPNALHCTILAADHPGLFSLITGVLGASGFAIESGAAYTYGAAPAAPAEASRAGLRQPLPAVRRRAWRGGPPPAGARRTAATARAAADRRPLPRPPRLRGGARLEPGSVAPAA